MDYLENNVKIKSAKYIGELFTNNLSRVIGHDGAYSIPLDDGRSFWTFGDTLIGPNRFGYDHEKELIDVWLSKEWARENIKMVENTGCFTNTKTGQELLSSRPLYVEKDGIARELVSTALAPNRGNRYRPIWPMDGFCYNGRLYVFYILVDCGFFDPSRNEQNLDINLYGVGLAKSKYPFYDFERLRPMSYPVPPKDLSNYCEYPFLWWNCEVPNKFGEQVPAFGTAVLKRLVDGYVYIYGSRVDKIDNEIVHGVYLSRVRPEYIEDLSHYEYYSKHGWIKQPTDLKLLFDGNANELSVSFNPYLNKYITIYSFAGRVASNGAVSSGAMEEIHLRTADDPCGPWSEPVVLYNPRKSMSLDICYAAKEHPELAEENGKIIYLTFVSHQRYWPELVRVEFE